MARKKRWSDAEVAFLLHAIFHMNDTAVAAVMSKFTGRNITRKAVERKLYRLDVKRQRGTRRQRIIRNYVPPQEPAG